jgi:hypothetical protein
MVSNELYEPNPRDKQFAFVAGVSTDNSPIGQVKKDEMGRVYSTNGAKKNAYKILVENPEVKRPLGRHECR